MIRERQTGEYLDALAQGVWETWIKDTALNPDQKRVVNHKGKRFEVDSRRQVTVKQLTESHYKMKKR